MPERFIFVEAYQQQTNTTPSQSELERHLLWIKRFYRGSVLYPLGWNRMTELLLDSLETQAERDEARQRLYTLGLRIAIEWAQDNAVRKINSSNVATWGNALKTSADRNEQLQFIGEVELDVERLISGELLASEISRERYYPPNDYDNF